MKLLRYDHSNNKEVQYENYLTTQMYLGKVSDNEAMRWIENLYA